MLPCLRNTLALGQRKSAPQREVGVWVSRGTAAGFQSSQPSLTSWLDHGLQNIYCREMFTTGDTQSARPRAHASGHQGDIVTTRGMLIQSQTPNLFIPERFPPVPLIITQGGKHMTWSALVIVNKMYPGQFQAGNLSESSLNLILSRDKSWIPVSPQSQSDQGPAHFCT